MANSRLFQFRYSYQRDMVDIVARVAIGASGAPTLLAGKGIVSISRVSAGRYLVTLKDNFRKLAMVDQVAVSASAPAAPSMFVAVDNVSSATAPSITIQMNAAGVATDPASGEVLLLRISTVNASDAQ